MKFLILFLCISSFQLSANVYSQIAKVSLEVKNASLEQVIQLLEKESGYIFLYEDAQIEQVQDLELNFKDEDLKVVLDECLQNSGLTYKLMNHTIVISRKNINDQVRMTPTKLLLQGIVKDADGHVLPGVAVVLKETTLGVATDVEGRFTIELPKADSIVLVFSFVGMQTKEVKWRGEKELNVVLEEAIAEMDEVVITGYFQRKKDSYTGAATTFSGEKLREISTGNILSALSTIDPSFKLMEDITAGSDPNHIPEFQIHGSGNLKSDYENSPNMPTFILDGFEATVQKIMDLDMDRIASLTILKDASAKAIYGSRAANGVIVIETKQNESGDLRVTYTGSVTLEVPDLTSYNLTNAAQKLQLEKEFGLYEPTDMNGEDVSGKELYMSKYKAVYAGVNTDWLAKPLHMGTGQKHSLSIELGGRDLRVMTTFSYNHIVGVMKGSTRDTYDGSLQVSYRHKKFNFRNILNVTSNVANDSPYGTFSEYAAMNPYYSPYDKNGFLVKNAALSVDGLETTEFVANPLYNATLNTKIENRYLDVTDNLYVEWSVLQGLKATLRFGITEKRTSADEFYPANHLKFYNYTGDDLFRKGSYQANTGHMKKLSGDLNVRYSTVVKEKHYLFTNVGLNLSDETYEEIVHKAEGFPNDRMNDLMFAKQYVKDTKPSGKESTIRDIGILGIFNYTYDNKYLFDASYRANASSQFGANNRWGSFWSIGVGWNMHKEAFMNSEIFENFKIRGSLGYTGSQSQDAYASIPTYVYTLDRTYTGLLSSQLQGMKNDDLKWQRKMDYNVGFDMNIKRRFSLTFDAYRSITDNTLIDLTLPPSNGFTTLRENAGEVINRGFDIRTSYTILQNVKERSFLTVNLNISRNKNKLAKLSDAMNVYNESQNASVSGTAPAQLYYDGVSMNAIWAVRSLGIDPHNGREIYLSSRGLPTYNWSAADQVVLGDEMPKFQGTGGISFEWKGIGGNASFTFQYGAQMYNTTLVQKVENANLSDNVDARLFDGVWRPGEGGVKPYRAPRYRDPSTGNWVTPETKPTSRFVQDRNEFALTNLSLYYDFYRYEFLKRCGMERLRVSAYANNLFTISSIEIERGTSYPFARSFNFSLSVTF